MSLIVINARLDIQKLLKHLIISLSIGIVASIFTGESMALYINNQNDFWPVLLPYSVIPIIWTIIYIGLGIAAYIAEAGYHNVSSSLDRKAILKLYYIHLLFNFMWPIILFTFNSAIFALVTMIILLFFISVLTIGFFKCGRSTLTFMIPYLVWYIYLALLNISML